MLAEGSTTPYSGLKLLLMPPPLLLLMLFSTLAWRLPLHAHLPAQAAAVVPSLLCSKALAASLSAAHPSAATVALTVVASAAGFARSICGQLLAKAALAIEVLTAALSSSTSSATASGASGWSVMHLLPSTANHASGTHGLPATPALDAAAVAVVRLVVAMLYLLVGFLAVTVYLWRVEMRERTSHWEARIATVASKFDAR